MRERRPVRPVSMGQQVVGPQAVPPVTNKAAGLGFKAQQLTRWQGVRRTVQHNLPRKNDINELFIATGRHQVRLNWRSPLAIPFVLSIVVLSPLLLLVAIYYRALDMAAVWQRARKDEGSGER